MENLLEKAGLNEAQAKAYLYVLRNGETTPPKLATALALTRSNAYKVLDRLTELNLIRRHEVDKKFSYTAEDPIALTGLVAEERNRLLELEHGIKESMHELRRQYESGSSSKDVRTYRGNTVIAALHRSHAGLKKPIRFIRTRADIPVMGYETMSDIRSLAAKHGTKRYGITPDATEAPLNPAIDRRTNLTRTWIHADDYTSPVEWSVTGDELLIITYQHEAAAVRINDPLIAKAFREIWTALDEALRTVPGYKKLPRQAGRKS